MEIRKSKHSSSKEIRVLMDTQAFDMQTHGGISRCFVELMVHLPKDINVKLPIIESRNIYLREKGLVSGEDSYLKYCKGHPTPINRFFYKLTTNIRNGHFRDWDRMPRLSIFETERLLTKGDFDVFHPTYYDTYFLRKLGNKPFVLTVHDMISELYPSVYKFKDCQLYGKRKLIPLASHIIAVSEQTKQDIIKIFNVPSEKISVIYHGANQTPYNPSGPHNMYGRYILYVGERDMYKNFSKFVRDISPVLHRHSDLLVICTGKPFEETEKRLLHEQRVFNKFIYKFVESQQELLDLYHYAIVFVYPSEYEGFGIPILESYKAGCPVLLNRASCFPEIAGDAAIYFDFNSCGNSLQDQIEDILTWSSSKKDELISKQYQRLLRYSWNKSAQELASIYRKVALGVL